MPELSLLSESTDISGRPHRFAEFNTRSSPQDFVPVAEEPPMIEATGGLSQEIYPPGGDFGGPSVFHQFTDLPGRPTQSVGFNSPGSSLQGSVPMAEETITTKIPGSSLQEINLSKNDFDISRGIVADETTEIKGQGIFKDIMCNGRCRGDLEGDHECKHLQRKLHITCLSNNCTHEFTRKRDFNRHCITKHSKRTKQSFYDCQFSGCARTGRRGFSRKDNMLQHVRKVHKVDIPVKKCRFGMELTL
ncbi:hypothetical protein DFP73DRAFT_284140 [Morchella snyderi]|nr:hypothetical protein DFP73DRAFT_284140 [Morchella snyderi]